MRVLIGLFLGALPLVGCDSVFDISDHSLAPDGGTPVDASTAFFVVDSGGAADAGPDGAAAGGCVAGALQCNGNTPQQCDAGAWQSLTGCGGSTPTCSNGLCGTYRTTGGIRSTAPAASGDGGIRLVSGGFEIGARSCDMAGVCVTGGVVP